MTPEQVAEAYRLHQAGEPIPDELSPWEGGENGYMAQHFAEVQWALDHGQMDYVRRLLTRPHWTETWYRTVGHDQPYPVFKQPMGLTAEDQEPAALDWDGARSWAVGAVLDRLAETLELSAPAPETADRPEDAPEPTPSPQASFDALLWSHTMRNPANRTHTLGHLRAQGNGRLRVRDSLDAVVKKDAGAS